MWPFPFERRNKLMTAGIAKGATEKMKQGVIPRCEITMAFPFWEGAPNIAASTVISRM
jgi:hypothetical protein